VQIPVSVSALDIPAFDRTQLRRYTFSRFFEGRLGFVGLGSALGLVLQFRGSFYVY